MALNERAGFDLTKAIVACIKKARRVKDEMAIAICGCGLPKLRTRRRGNFRDAGATRQMKAWQRAAAARKVLETYGEMIAPASLRLSRIALRATGEAGASLTNAKRGARWPP